MELNKSIQIGALLDKYFEGETSLAEEQTLKDYFSSTEVVPAEYEYARAMFGHFIKASQSTNFSQGGNKKDRSILLTQVTTSKPVKRIKLRLIRWSSVAATVAAVVTLGISIEKYTSPTVYCYINGKPVTDINIAMVYSEEAIDLVSESLSKPVEYLEPIEAVGQALENIKYLSIFETD